MIHDGKNNIKENVDVDKSNDIKLAYEIIDLHREYKNSKDERLDFNAVTAASIVTAKLLAKDTGSSKWYRVVSYLKSTKSVE